MQSETKQSILTLENRNKLTFSGVERVEALSDRQILLTVNGTRVRIEGNKLKVLAFSEGSGNFAASGVVDSVRFLQGGKGVSRIFK